MQKLSAGRIDLCRRRRAALLLGSILASGFSVQAMAQSLPPDGPPIRVPMDENGIDLASGRIIGISDPGASIGADEGGLTFSRELDQYGYWQHPYKITLYSNSSIAIIYYGAKQRRFTLSGGVYVSDQGDGATLTSSGGGNFTYTAGDGTVTNFGSPQAGAYIYALSQVSPDGRRLNFHYRTEEYCSTTCFPQTRVQSITDNRGYQLKIGYQSDSVTGAFFDIASVKLINNAVDYCNPVANSCTGLTQSWPTLTYSSTQPGGGVRLDSVTDALGRVTEYTFQYTLDWDDRLIGIKRPGSSSNDVTISYTTDGTFNYVSSVVAPGRTTNYSWSLNGTTLTGVASDSLGTFRTTTANRVQGVVLTDKNGLNQTTSFVYDTSGRLSEVVYPEGNKVQYTYQSATRNNVTQVTRVPKAGSGLANIVTSAGYDASCSNLAKCNKPNWTKDALGNETDYTYNSTTGQLLTVTQPAATSGGTRPKVTYGYASKQAYYKNSGGSIVASGQPISLITTVSTCLSGATCSGTANEAKTTINYGPQSTGTANNLLPVAITDASGNGAITATSSFAYDYVGNLTSVDGPLSGTGDTTAYRYDLLRRTVGMIGPDPDGAGSRKNAALRVSYDTKGRITLTEQGYTAGQTTTAWNAFTPAGSVAATYDGADRKLTETLKNGSTSYGLTQYSYDARGRLACSTDRMNPSIYGSLPASACTLGTAGSFGPDRITKYTYNAVSQTTLVQSAYGTADQANETSTAYTNNGQVSYVVDANLNRTTYEYDGHDRLLKTRYPVATKGSNSSSTTDYELLTYGDNVHVTVRRLRDGNTLGLSYDNLGRVTSLGGSTIADRTFTYNLLGMQTGATFVSGGQSVTNAFDAFGRVTSQVTPQGTVGYQYDAASRRTRITWPDNFYVVYDHDSADNVTAIRENGATSGIGVLASYSYDDLGRRTGVTYGNGTSRTYAYDAVNRTAGIKIDPAGTTNDLIIGAVGGVGTAVSYNPALQIASIVKSNDAYAWTGHYNFNRNYTTNGLNQYTASGATSLGYDGRGNLTSSGSTTYAYNGLNQLTSVSGGPSATLTYDPADRLYQLVSGGVTTRFLYDGVNMIGEYNGSNALLRRFVPGPGTDEPILWYEGAGTTNRRWLHADERGSIVALTDASGAAVGLNRYDEYGIPQSSNLGRFQYTGQVWLTEAGLYYYKARMYSPTLGRFMQTDPIGYGDGMNWYNYVGGDSVNLSDPTGLSGDCNARNRPGDDDYRHGISVTCDRDDDDDDEDDPLDRNDPRHDDGKGGRGDGKESKEKDEQKGDIWKCLGNAGMAFVDGAIDPEGTALALGVAAWHAANRTAPEDYRPLTKEEKAKPRNRGTLKRSFGSALRIGARRAIPGYVAVSAAVGTINAAVNVAKDPSCKAN